MADYLSLEDAAKKLGISTDRLVELRSQGQVRGFRDGASWKFPVDAIDNLADELADSRGGSGDLVGDFGYDSGMSVESGAKIIGGDEPQGDGGSDIEVGGETSADGSGGSDVNLVASLSDDGEGSDVSLVASDDDKEGISDSDFLFDEDKNPIVEIDSAELQLDGPAIEHDSAMLDISGDGEGSDVSLDDVLKEAADSSKSGLSFSGISEEDSDDVLIGEDDEDSVDVLVDEAALSKSGSAASASGMSSLELMDDLDSPIDVKGNTDDALKASGDVLSELDLLGGEQSGSGLISGDSEDLLASSSLGSSLELMGMSDESSDDLMIADDDDDLVISSAESDLSVAGDSGINLMSPSDSGLSLESEPLDLASSSISSLDLGKDDGNGSGSGVDFQADEDFQLSPSGIGLEAEPESGSQVIEVEDSQPIDVEVAAFDDPAVGLPGDEFGAEAVDGFTDAGGFDDGDGFGQEAEEVGIESTSSRAAVGAAATGTIGYEVPFSLLQCVALVMIIAIMSLGGMLMTDLLRNMWTYTEPSAPVSSLTDSLISLMGLNP
ncbi:Helix-turn-helix domain protein [Novipirellula aureliae]|uniref:Helix-turn-helix domain protein n=1 Tax=Novipirellula aureliae TaxID=2527966 RepID=A0A5C6DVF5_9BACT|nr:DNA-binding protein [Novipirellula aureliae]TWU38779.1 Helix-turn-helix domain protein [Novipirellula aureliae]